MRCGARPSIAALTVVAALVAAPAAGADASRSAGQPPEAIPPYERLSALWWQAALSIPRADNPLLEEGRANCGLGQGRVRFLFGTFTSTTGPTGDVVATATRRCSIRQGTLLFLPALNGECSTAEANGTTEAELRACATGLIDPVDPAALTLTVDGVSLPTYRVASRLFEAALPPENVLGVPAQTSGAVSDGYWALLAPLRRGKHVVTFGGSVRLTETTSFTTRVTYTIKVRRHRRADPGGPAPG